MNGERWGPWRLDPDLLVLRAYDSTGYFRYEVDLERCTTSAGVLDYVVQVSGKRWADGWTVAGLVGALVAVLGPQANLCSFGVERGPISPEALRSLVASAVRGGAPLVTDLEPVR